MKKFRFEMKVVVFIMLSIALFAGAQQTVGKWDLFELPLRNEKIYDNPFKDVSLLGEFTHIEDKRTIKIYGFYDGGTIWKIRFMPDKEGKWRYKVYFSDSSTKSVEGHFLCVPSKIKGPLRVYQRNSIWFSYHDGTPFYMFAFEAGELDVLPELGVLDETLDFLQKYNFNTVVGPHCGLSETPGIGYRAPWVNTGEGFDFSRYDLRFWRNMDKVIFALKKRNMFLIPFSIFGGTNNIPKMPKEEWESFIRYWTARWSGFYNVTFQPTSEWEEGFNADEVLQILGLIRKYDPWGRLISVHSWNYSKKALQIPRSEFYDYFTLQDKLTDWNYWKYVETMQEIRRVAEKPILAQECIWEGNGYQQEAGLDVDNLRRGSWTILLSGAYLSYGDEVTPPRKVEERGIHFSNMGMSMKPAGKLYPYLKIMYQVITSLPWWDLRPYLDFEGEKHPVCMASQDKSTLLVYLPEGGDIALKGLSGTFEARYIDPIKGTEDKKTRFEARDGKLVISSEKEHVVILKRIM